MIGLVVGQVEFEQVQAAVDGLDQADLASQSVEGTDAAAAQAAGAVGDLVVEVGPAASVPSRSSSPLCRHTVPVLCGARPMAL